MAIGIGVRRVRGLLAGLERSTRPIASAETAAGESSETRAEFEMQRGSAQSQETFLGSVGLARGNSAKAGEPKEAREAQIPADSQRVFAHPCSPAASWRSLVALSHEPLGSDVNALQSLVIGDRNRRHSRERNAHGVQRR